MLVALSLAAAAALVVGHRDERVAPMIGVAGSAVAALLALVVGAQHWGFGAEADVTGSGQIDTGGIPITVALRVDQLGASMLVLATMVALLVQIYSVAYLRGDPRYPSYTALVSIFTAAMCLVVTADDLFVLLVGWEVMGVCSYFLISHHWELEPARSGAAQAFLMTRLGDIGLLFGIFVIGQCCGHLPDQRGRTGGDRRRHQRPRRHDRLAAHAVRRGRQVRPVPAALLAARRDARPDADQRADPRRHDGRGRRLPGRPVAAGCSRCPRPP